MSQGDGAFNTHPIFAPSGEQPFGDDFMQQLDFHNLFADDLFVDDDSFLLDLGSSPTVMPQAGEREEESAKLPSDPQPHGSGAGIPTSSPQQAPEPAPAPARKQRTKASAASAQTAIPQNPIAAVTAEFSTRSDVWDDSTPSRLSDRAGPISDAERLAGRVASAAASVAVEGPLDTRAIADRLIARQNRQGGSDDSDDDDEDDDGNGGAKRGGKRTRRSQSNGDDDEGDDEPSQKRPRRRAATREERVARSRERNRIHARKSRLRKKFFVDSLKASLGILERENQSLRRFLREKLGRSYEELSQEASAEADNSSTASREANVDARAARAASIVARDPKEGTQSLEDGDFQLMLALQVAQQNFVVSDPNLPDNPIVFASDGFYQLTGYSPSEVIGRNCRFLQGPETDPESVQIIREGVRQGRDTSVCLVNYKKDGAKFWNRFFVAPLRGLDGRVVNFVGVQSEVSEGVARSAIRDMKQKAMASRAVAEAISEKRKASRSAAGSGHGGGSDSP